MAKGGVQRLRIVTALLAAFLVVSLAPLVSSHYALIKINREALETNEKKYLTRSAVSLARDIQVYLRDAQSQLHRIGGGLKLAGSMAPTKDPFIFAGTSGLLADERDPDQSLLVLRALDPEGQGGVAERGPVASAVESELGRIVPRVLRGESVIGDVIHTDNWPFGGIVMGVPVGSGTNVAGLVEAFVSLAPVKSWLDEEKKRDVTAYVVDRTGKLILASDMGAFANAEYLKRAELVQEFIAHPVRLTKSYERTDGENRWRVLGTVAPVETPDWGVIVEKDELSAYGAVRQMTSAMWLAGAAAVFFAAVAAFGAARTLSRPVTGLAQKVRQIAEGNFSQRVEVRGSKELAQLAESFNSMSDSLERSMEKLRQAAKENQELFINSIRTLAAAIDAKDPYTRGHSERVARYAVVLARHYGMQADEIKRIRIAALLHDVGKIGIDDRILRKPTALTDEEFEVMKTHPVKGALIMGQIPQLKDVVPGIKHHHEKWEGGGYPDGLAGVEIPLVARVVSVADTFDAMTTTRPYQKAMQLEYVVGRIKSFSGTRFDPDVVSALDKAFSNHDLEVVGEAARLAVSA